VSRATEPQGQVRTPQELRAKIEEVRARIAEATKPVRPLSLLKITTST
jgi:hypothetical protein